MNDRDAFMRLSRQFGDKLALHPDYQLPELHVPSRIEQQGDRLLWWESVGRVEPPDDLLHRFTALADGQPEDVLAFAREFGVLQICEHGLPASHNPVKPGEQTLFVEGCYPAGWCDRPTDHVAHDPLSAWYRFAADARAILRLAQRLHSGHIGGRTDWQTVYGHNRPTSEIPWWKPNLAGERAHVANLVNEWLTLGNVRPALRWGAGSGRSNGTAGLVLVGGGLFAVLAAQLAREVSRAESLVICNGCGVAYLPKRRPQAGRRAFCPTCRANKVPQRLAQRDHVARKTGA